MGHAAVTRGPAPGRVPDHCSSRGHPSLSSQPRPLRPPSAFSIPASAGSPFCAPYPSLSQARFAFIGDTARLPYGSKSRRTIARYAVESTQFLVREQGAEFLVIACNTASALALDAIQAAAPVPVLGVIEPGAAAARAASAPATSW